jgi:magnesium and cobalt exporter, CNNM family
LRKRANAGDRGAMAALALADEPTRFLSTVQIGITLIGILAGAFGGATIADQLAAGFSSISALADYAEAVSLAIVVAAVTFLSLIVGELVPKRLALSAPDRVAVLMSRPMRVLATAAGPLVWLTAVTTELILKLLRTPASCETTVSEEEVRLLIAEGAEAGVFEPAERHMMEHVFEFGEIRIRELMTARPRVVWISTTQTPIEAWRLIVTTSHAFFPLCEGELDRVVGVVAMRDLVQDILEQFKQVDSPLALVIDEHSGVSGVLTPTNLLEALAGELASSGNIAIKPVRRTDGSWLLDGLTHLDEVVELLEIAPNAHSQIVGVDTLGGLSMVVLGRIPRTGDRFVWGSCSFEVVDMDGLRVDKVLARAA